MGLALLMRLGIIARSDNTGLGNQTRELVNMLSPTKILLIDSTRFNGNKQHPEWYSNYNTIKTAKGFPTTSEMNSFLDGLDTVISCETFYSQAFVDLAKRKNVKTILQYNYEFLDYLNKVEGSLPDIFAAPSLWNFEKVQELLEKQSKVIHLPPPTDASIFSSVREINISKKHNRILHVAGKAASKDRNGTESVIKMLKHSKADYELIITTQSDINYEINDDRIKIVKDNPENRESLYSGFDAMILPRRYAGLCLPMNEALLSSLPVFMTNISPNNKVLPAKWLAKSNKIDTLMTRTLLDVYDVDPISLASIVDNYMNSENMLAEKQEAYYIGASNFSTEVLKDRYLEIIKK